MGFSAEIEFLLKVSSLKRDNINKKILINLIDKIERWDWLVECAARNSVVPLIYYNLRKINAFDYIPENYKNTFENQYRLANARNLKLRGVFIEIAKKLSSAQINLMALKGIALQFELYEHPALRPMIDIDLMVSDVDSEKAKKILLEMGCKTEVFSESTFIDSLKHHFPPFFYKDISIEIHRSLFDVYDTIQMPVSQVWENTEMRQIEGLQIHVLKKHLQLLYLCHHVFSTLRGGKVKLIWYLDILLFLRKYKEILDWAFFDQLVGKANACESVYHSLGIINYLFSEDLFNETIQNKTVLYCPKPQEIIPFLENKTFKPEMSHYLYKFGNIKSLPDKIRYLFNRIFPNIEFIRKKYCSSNYFSTFIGYLKELFSFISLCFKTIGTNFIKIQKNTEKKD